ncbi:MAG: hypothetical protein K8I29_19440 [Alphaproteobacteria bacterium]|uniref:Uncharacterized protein n=1 Tax=Candidatus Nitrobium versatile TaxID=2884831 RepID=A0A953M3M9_9BACT|nr:hypothetical protein [Candidatus Nitrobium versatile]
MDVGISQDIQDVTVTPEVTEITIQTETPDIQVEAPSVAVSVSEPAQVNITVAVQGAPGTDGNGMVSIPFRYGDATPKDLVVALAGKVVYSVALYITESFDGVGASLSVGDAGNAGRLMQTTENDPLSVGGYITNPSLSYGADTQLLLTINQGAGASQGAGVVLLQIEP